ncbi:MAG: hypothetical protein IJE84_05095 [Clostridia bacterium]|nr:hypothetical protein [Clostridia bacterium]
MKHIFVVNTHAGKAKAKEEIERLLVGFDSEYEVYYTKGHKDATEFARARCERERGSDLRFYACGGDGTIKEVAEGILGFENADLTTVPLGSGNDFVKYYGGADRFLDLKALSEAPSEYIDMIRVNDEFCINAVNFGFESYAAKVMNDVRHKKFIGGKNSYTTGILKGLLFAMKNYARVTVEGEELIDGEYLLCSVANGRYVGGAYMCAPRALNDDGLLEVCAVDTISRLSVPKLIKIYQAGKHLEDASFRKIIHYTRGKRVEAHFKNEMPVTLDGEMISVRDVVCEVMPRAVRFAALPVRVEDKEPENSLARV